MCCTRAAAGALCPGDYPDSNLCYYYYRVWRDHTDAETGQPLLELALQKLISSYRASAEKDAPTTFLIIDARALKTRIRRRTEDTIAGKKYPALSATSRWTPGVCRTFSM